uniref:Uncharacterized protein n=1 Tax=Polytomella parva TaxID=51329 RepID=A0A7S0VHW6_9CHLO|mmetsp:Transcript_32545/g.59072  ORF Transcript_32545/g.59072 Transcript_32545/m.59072 type:complete len:149 (+) Transcript_32545:146-592(+)
MADQGEVTTELTATQYVILAENQRKKKALAETKSQFSKLTSENRILLKQLEETQRENYQVTEHLREELLKKTEEVTALETDIVKLAHEKNDEIARTESTLKEEIRHITDDAAAKHRALQEQVTALQTQLNNVLEFKERQGGGEDALMR